jgi:hypothetical protein
MLARSQNRTAAVVIFDLWEEGSFLLLSAFGVLMFMLLMASARSPIRSAAASASRNSSSAMIRVEGLSKTFAATHETVAAVAGVDFEVGPASS